MPPTLYHVPRTISSPIVQVLYELNLIETNKVNIKTLTFTQLKAPEHLARNPMGTSPAFTDDEKDIAIWESGAVLTYILEFYDNEHKLHPPPGSSAKDRAIFLHLQQYIIATVYPFLASLFIHTLKPSDEQDVAYIACAKEKFTALLGPTLVKFLGSSEYFMGDKVSAIDFLAAKPLGNAHSLCLLEDFPALPGQIISQDPKHAFVRECLQRKS
jgi:glutathione S-transferase